MDDQLEQPLPHAPDAPRPVAAPQSEPRLALARTRRLTLSFCAICVALFAAIAVFVPHFSWDAVARWGYPSADRIWDGAYWGLVTSAFVHLALWHVAFNVYWWWRFGSPVEELLGPARYAAFVLGAAVVSSGVQLGASGVSGHGASGVGYALFGFIWCARRSVPAFASALHGRAATLFWAWLVGCILATRLADASVGNAAHLGGLIFGLAAGHWLVLERRVVLAKAALGLLVVASLLSLAWSPWSAPWVGHRAHKAHTAGQYDAAIEGYRRSLDLDGTQVWLLQNLALAYHAKGANAEYAATLAQVRATSTDAAAEVEQLAGETVEHNQKPGAGTASEAPLTERR